MIRPALATWLLLALVTALTAAAGDWPHLRGPWLDGRSSETGLLGAGFTLETAWKHPLGMAYSAVSVAEGKAVTLFSDGRKDVAIAFDAVTGKELWRTPFADTHRGHDGSTGGPVGTPSIGGEQVYVVGPFGQLLALALTDGRILWSRDLLKDFGAEPPFYGFSATPLVFGPLLIIQTGGGDGRSVTALDRHTGELRWSAGDDRVTHPSPVVMDVYGERLLISVGSTRITAIRMTDGEVTWSHAHSEKPPYDPTYPQALPMRGNRILLAFEDEAVLYRLPKPKEAIEEIWRSRGFRRSSATPVADSGYLYGFNGSFLTCLQAANGEVVWKSRPPGGRGLILVDGHLFVLGSGGWLTVVEATPEEYREKARLRVSEQGGYTAPSFADGHVFVRNLAHVAGVRIVRRPGDGARPAVAAEPASGELAAWVRRVTGEPSEAARKRRIDEYMAGQASFPVVEGEGRVHFIYRGPADAVSVVGHMQADREEPEPLARIPGTDFFYRSYELEPDGRWHYRFQVDFDDPAPDPLNPRRALGEPDEVSELVMPGFHDPDHIQPVTDGSRVSRLEDLELDSAALGKSVTVRVYLPAGYGESTAQYPLLIVPNGEQWLAAELRNTLDHLLGRAVRPAVVAFVPIAGWVGGNWGGPAGRLIADELLPRLEDAYRIDVSPGSTALWTVQEKAAVALDLVHQRPDRFGRVALQSPRTYRAELPPLADHREHGLRFFVSWSRYESRSAEKGFDEGRAARDLQAWLEGIGLRVEGGELVGGPGFRTWRRQAEEILEFLLPPGH